MGEAKRVLLSPRRLILAGLLTLLSAALFFLGRMEYFGDGAVDSMLDGERYYAWLVNETADLEPEARREFLEREGKLVSDFRNLSSWGDLGGDGEEIRAQIAQREFFDNFEKLAPLPAVWRLSTAAARIEELLEELDYVEGYSEYLDEIQTTAQLQSQTALFGAEGSFARRNIAKTAREFDTLRDVEAQYGSNRAVEAWVDFEAADYLYLILICAVVMAFLEERRVGLWGLVRATKEGGARLWLSRVLILAAGAALGTALVYGVDLLLSLSLTGGFGGLSRSVQSLPVFRTLTLHLSLGQWIWLYLTVKTLCGFVVGLFLWCVLGMLANAQFSLAVLGVTLAGEYALFEFLPVQSIFNILKYFNLFSCIRTSRLYTDYLNIDLFGWPVGIRQMALTVIPVLAAGLLVWSLLISLRRRPQGSRDMLGALAGRWNKAADAPRRRLSLGGWEVYKTLIFQRGVIVFLVIFIASGSLKYFRSVSTGAEDPWYLAYIADLTGPLDEDMTGYFSNARLSAGDNPQLLSVIDRVEEHVEEVRAKAEAGGYEPWIATTDPYRVVYGPDSIDAQRASAAAAIVFIVIPAAAVGVFERQWGAEPMVRATKRGRRGLYIKKLAALLVITAFVWCFVYMRELWQYFSHFRPLTLQSPIWNLEGLDKFPVNVTVGGFIDLIYALRFVMLFLTAAGAMAIGRRMRSPLMACSAALLALGAPAVLGMLGVKAMYLASPLSTVSGAEILWGMGAAGGMRPVWPLIIWFVIGVAALVADFRSWTSGETRR